MLIHMMQDASTWLTGVTHLTDAFQMLHLHLHLPPELAALGDRPLEDNLGTNVQKAFNNFVKTGQVWAFLIGLIIGYIFKAFTSFG